MGRDPHLQYGPPLLVAGLSYVVRECIQDRTGRGRQNDGGLKRDVSGVTTEGELRGRRRASRQDLLADDRKVVDPIDGQRR